MFHNLFHGIVKTTPLKKKAEYLFNKIFGLILVFLANLITPFQWEYNPYQKLLLLLCKQYHRQRCSSP